MANGRAHFAGRNQNQTSGLSRTSPDRPHKLDELIYQAAQDLEISELEESLKWGEPCYSSKAGSPVRMDWKLKTPDQYFLYFNCQTKLVDTFREVYADILEFQGNRAITLKLAEAPPEDAIKHCIALALNYKKIKHLPLLGA